MIGRENETHICITQGLHKFKNEEWLVWREWELGREGSMDAGGNLITSRNAMEM